MTKMTAEQRRLVEKNLDLAHHHALQVWRRNQQGMDRAEVISVAYQGLITAALKFDPHHHKTVDENFDVELAFTGYASRKIMGAILDWQRSRDHVPRRQRKIYRDLQSHGHGQGKTHTELVGLTGYQLEDIQKATQAVEGTVVSLDIPSEYSEGIPYYALHADTTVDIESDAMVGSLVWGWVKEWDDLPLLQKRVIVGKYFFGHDLVRISQELGVRLPLVRDAHQAAVLRIHAAMLKQVS